MGKKDFPVKTVVVSALAILLLIAVAVLGTSVVETVPAGSYQIKQAAVTGHMSAKMTPGLWGQWFGDVQTWPKAETFYFTADNKEGGPGDASIKVMFNDGSDCQMSGTCRVVMPVTEQDAINLVTTYGFRTHTELEDKMVLPVIRNSLNRTANLMSARESYSDRRPEFVSWAWDQIQNGLYQISEETKKEPDPVSGEMVTKTYKIIKRDKDGNPLREANPWKGTGIMLSNFEIKDFVYSKKVSEQIVSQQEALMAVSTARANAQRAEQDALTEEAKGKAAVMKDKYEEEQKKIRAVVQAQKEKEVAELSAAKEVSVAKLQKEVAETNASKQVEVAKLEKDASEFNKQRDILTGQGEAEKKRLAMEADGALQQKLAAWVEVNRLYAEAMRDYKGNWVPGVVFGGATGQGNANGATSLIDLLTAKTAKDLALDLGVKPTPVSKKDEGK